MDAESQEWMTVRETAKLLRIPLTRCYELVHRGEIPAVRIGERSIRLNRAEVDQHLKNNRRVYSYNPFY